MRDAQEKCSNMIKSEFPSPIDIVGNNSDVKKKIILSSSINSKVLNVPLLVSLNQVSETPEPNDFNQGYNAIAVILEGQFESVFNNRLTKEYTVGVDFNVKEGEIFNARKIRRSQEKIYNLGFFKQVNLAKKRVRLNKHSSGDYVPHLGGAAIHNDRLSLNSAPLL